MDLGISVLDAISPAHGPFEIVERKGRGHPDTMCDAMAEAFSRALSAYYLERFGAILHHNVDKALLAAGSSRPAFGGGVVLAPIEIYLAGRAVTEFRGVTVPVESIAAESSRQWLREHMPALDAEKHVRIHVLVRPASADLQDLFMRAGTALANDTSFGVGYAPLDELERVVLSVGRRLSDPAAKAACAALGEDHKVLGVRRGRALGLTVACALVDQHVASLDDYYAAKARVHALVLDAARETTVSPVTARVNAADGTTADSVFLTVTGTSAEAGDDGEVGRGNRVNGLITPYRPMSLEAAAGKNPVTHVGKLYNLAAHRLARSLAAELPGVEHACCFLVSEIGRPIRDPSLVDVRIALAAGDELERLRPRIRQLVCEELDGIETLWRSLATAFPIV